MAATFVSGGGLGGGSGFGFQSDDGGLSGFQPAMNAFATANPTNWGFTGGATSGGSPDGGFGG